MGDNDYSVGDEGSLYTFVRATIRLSERPQRHIERSQYLLMDFATMVS